MLDRWPIRRNISCDKIITNLCKFILKFHSTCSSTFFFSFFFKSIKWSYILWLVWTRVRRERESLPLTQRTNLPQCRGIWFWMPAQQPLARTRLPGTFFASLTRLSFVHLPSWTYLSSYWLMVEKKWFVRSRRDEHRSFTFHFSLIMFSLVYFPEGYMNKSERTVILPSQVNEQY